MDMLEDWNILYSQFSEPKQTTQCCNDPFINFREGYATCTNCGLADLDKQEYTYNSFNDYSTYKHSAPYKRIVYFKQKLNMINNLLLYKLQPNVLFFIEKNKGKNIKNIYKLKKAMKNAGLNKQYKYIYSIYYSITNKKLISINMNDYEIYLKQFNLLEKIFIKNKIRANLYSYNVIIYFLLKINNNDGYKYMILPLNKTKLKKKLRELIYLCGYQV